MAAKKPPPPEDFDDDAPMLTSERAKRLRPASEWFEKVGIRMPTPRGRPKAEITKKPVTIRMSGEVIAYFKAEGPGWQTRINDVLEREVRKRSR